MAIRCCANGTSPYRIGALERDRWLLAMMAAIEKVDPIPEVREALVDYVVNAAEHLRNDGG